MEFSSIVPKADHGAQPVAAPDRPAPQAMSTAAETDRPVLAAAKSDTTRGATGEEFQPLDTFEVGDNDHIPVPPEPPRKETVLAVIASAAEADIADTVASSADSLADTLRNIDTGPDNPTVDIRR